jgi:hypothetical protein
VGPSLRLAILVALVAPGCGFTARVGVAPTVDTRGDVRLDFVLGGALTLDVGEAGAPEVSASMLEPMLSGSPDARTGSGWGLGGVMVSDHGPNGRIGLSLHRRHLLLSDGARPTLYGVGARVAALAPLYEKKRRVKTIFGFRRQAYQAFQLGAELDLRWLWGARQGRGELALPLLAEFWFL